MKTSFLPNILSALGVFAVAIGAASAQDRGDHLGAYNFTIEIEGLKAGQFKSVDGLSMEIEVVEYRSGNEYIIRKLPGRAKFGDITLKRGYLATDVLQNWWHEVVQNPAGFPKRNVSVILKDPDTDLEVSRWSLHNCWPRSWKVSGFDGKGNDIVTEELTLVVEDIRFTH